MFKRVNSPLFFLKIFFSLYFSFILQRKELIMKAKVITMTPDRAKTLLQQNKKNRKVNLAVVSNYAKEMRLGNWKENGESIIVDTNGLIKDGQHRLKACIEANHIFDCVLVEDVFPDVMHSIDVGRNRSLKDILDLNGFSYAGEISMVTKSILAYKQDKIISRPTLGLQRYKYISHSVALDFIYKNESDLLKIAKESKRIFRKSKKVLNLPKISKYLYLIAGDSFNYTDDHLDFIYRLCGIVYFPNNGASWVFDKLYNAKMNKITLNEQWIHNAVVKAWNNYATGDLPIKSFKVNVDKKERIISV